MTSIKRATARESVMAPKLALFHAVTTEQRAEWSDTRLAAHCGASVWTIRKWIIRYPIAFPPRGDAGGVTTGRHT
jgi:hypothetical protein